MGIAKPCTQLHPAPSTLTQLISTSNELHQPPFSLFHPPPSSLYVIRTKIAHVIGQFPHIWAEKIKVVSFA